MAARRGRNMPAGPVRERADGGERRVDAAEPGQREAFCQGLYPILVDGDPVAFRRYLAQWEDVIGDSAELAEAPLEQQRQTMASLLRHPQRFNLPPWPVAPRASAPRYTISHGDDLLGPEWEAPAAHPAAAAAPPAGTNGAPRGAIHQDAEGEAAGREGEGPTQTQDVWPRTPGPDTRAPATLRPESHTTLEAAAEWVSPGAGIEVPEVVTAETGAYQIDMFTGEFQPVIAAARGVAEGAEEAYEPAAPKKRRRPRQRRAGIDLVQLSLMPDLDPAEPPSPLSKAPSRVDKGPNQQAAASESEHGKTDHSKARRTGSRASAMRMKPTSVGWEPSTAASPSSPNRLSPGT